MDLVSELRDATRLVLNISFHFEVNALSNTWSSGDRSIQGICLTKPAGKLEFTLNTSVLNIKAIQKNPFDLKFVGAAKDQQTVVWTPQLPDPHPSLSVGGFNETIDSLTGSVTTALSVLAPPFGASCGNENRAYILALNSIGDNKLDAEAGPGSLPITNLVVNGNAGSVEQIGLKINQFETNECVGLAVEGEPASFDVIVTGVPQGASVSYKWSVSAGKVVGTDASSLFKALMPSPPTPVMVTVVITVHEANRDVILSTSAFVPVLSNAVALQLERMCKIFMEAPHNWPVFPLWDPLRDFGTLPIFEQQLRQIREFGESLGRAGQALMHLTNSKEGLGSLQMPKREQLKGIPVVMIGGPSLDRRVAKASAAMK
jgi:hypothetical protein